MAARWVVPWVSTRADDLPHQPRPQQHQQQIYRVILLRSNFWHGSNFATITSCGSKRGMQLRPVLASVSASSPTKHQQLLNSLTSPERLQWDSRTHYSGTLTEANEGERVRICGWVASHRSQGNSTFVNLRDHSGTVQIATDPTNYLEAHLAAERVRTEYVVAIEGTVRRRPKEGLNLKMSTGSIEVLAENVQLLNPVRLALPFPITTADDAKVTISEEVPLRHHHLVYLARLNWKSQDRSWSRASCGTRDLCEDAAQGNGSRHTDSAGSTSEAIAVLKNHLRRGITIYSFTYVKVLQMCWKQKDLLAAKQVHDCIIESGMDKNLYVASTLLNLYIRCGRFLDARRVFDQVEKKSVITWTMMIGGYAESGHPESALELFKSMRQEGVLPNEVTFLCVLKACASPLCQKWGREIHQCVRDAGFESDVRVGTALLQMYAKCGCITEARRVFDSLTNRNFLTWNVMIGAYAASGNVDDARRMFDRMTTRNLIIWNVMIGAYAKSGRGVEAHGLFLEMRREGFEPNVITYMSILNASARAGALEWVKDVHAHARKAGLESDSVVGARLVHMYTKFGCLDDARLVFNRLKTVDVKTWNIMIGAYAQHGFGHKAFQLFRQMRRKGFEPDAFTFMSILDTSASAGALEWMKEVHAHAIEAGLESDLRVGNSLVHMYAKSGSIDDARLVFDRLDKRDAATWNIMIGGLAQHGCGHEALDLFRKMNEGLVKPTVTTFAAVLSACCHAGLLDDGRRLFLAMTQDYGIEPNIVHYTCMVDLLGRAGHLEEAKLFISNMPVAPNAVTWQALSGACIIHGNEELGERAANELLKLEPSNASAYVLLSNIYAAAGKWEKKSMVRTLMQERGVRKEPGRSWIEVNNKIHNFVVGDTSHPEAKAIYTELNKLIEKLKAEGYIPDTQLVLQNINEEDKELVLCSHSEKLAITYGLMCIPGESPIRVYKNLRVCSDCHTAIKFISKLIGREVIARDAYRFHHFKDGVCSCGDYW